MFNSEPDDLGEDGNVDESNNVADTLETQTSKRRNLAGFWLLGLCNNFAYVIMLSAAHDILREQESHHAPHPKNTTTTTTMSPTADPGRRECNTISTGAVLLADILPTLIIKAAAPWFLDRISYIIRVSTVVIFAAASFLIVSFSSSVGISLFGVVCASISAGLGEPTFLSLTSYHHKDAVSTWSSGTGAAGLFGALSYAGLILFGLTPRITLLVMLCIPVLLFFSYVFIIKTPPYKKSTSPPQYQPLIPDNSHQPTPSLSVPLLSFRHKLTLIYPLFIFMIPLLIVYFAEYFINQGLTELIEFDLNWITLSDQYRWYQVDYQLGVFISRSSVNILPIKRVWILSLLQCFNLVLFLFEAYYLFIPSFWIVLILILFEGLLGGSAYVNTFYQLRNETPEEEREYVLTFASLADTTGISLAGLIALPVHDYICAVSKPT